MTSELILDEAKDERRLADILNIRYSEYTISDIQADVLNI